MCIGDFLLITINLFIRSLRNVLSVTVAAGTRRLVDNFLPFMVNVEELLYSNVLLPCSLVSSGIIVYRGKGMEEKKGADRAST